MRSFRASDDVWEKALALRANVNNDRRRTKLRAYNMSHLLRLMMEHCVEHPEFLKGQPASAFELSPEVAQREAIFRVRNTGSAHAANDVFDRLNRIKGRLKDKLSPVVFADGINASGTERRAAQVFFYKGSLPSGNQEDFLVRIISFLDGLEDSESAG